MRSSGIGGGYEELVPHCWGYEELRHWRGLRGARTTPGIAGGMRSSGIGEGGEELVPHQALQGV